MSSTFVPTGGSPVPMCQRCQASLAPGEVICRKCGYQNISLNTGSLQTQSPSGITSMPKKGGLLQQYANQQAVPTFTPPPQSSPSSTPPPQSSAYPIPPYQSGSVPAQQANTDYPALPASSGSFAPFKTGSGQLPSPQSNSHTNLSSYPPINAQIPLSRPASGQLLQPGQLISTPFQQQVSAGYLTPPIPPGASQPLPANYALPPQAHNTDSFQNAPGQMAAMASHPMPSMPIPTPSLAHLVSSTSTPRNPLNAPQNESPNWARLAIIIVLLLVLASGGYLSYVKFASLNTPTQKAHTGPISYQPKGTPLISDGFASNMLGWNLQSDEANFAVTIGNGNLTLQNNTHKLLWELLPGTHTYDNFQIAFDATLSGGDQNNGYGVYMRGASNNTTDLANYYRFELYGDASYAFFKGATDATGKTTDTKLIGYTGSAFINKQGKLNHVLIIVNGSKFILVVNGQMLKTFTDTSYTTGTIAFFVSNLPNAKAGATAQFANFAIYPPNSK